MFDTGLLAILACPPSKEKLRWDAASEELVADGAGTRYGVRAGIPLLLGPAPGDRPVEDPVDFAAGYDSIIAAPPMKALYADSDYFNVGYWQAGASGLAQACDHMVDELAAAVPAGARVVLDVGCGRGAGTRRLAEQFPAARVVGINISLDQLIHARRRGLAAAVVSDAAHLGVASGVADSVIACESAQHFDTRADFLAEAYRILRPGGTIALADMLFVEREPVGAWLLPSANAVDGVEAYAELLGSIGFRGISVRDATDVTWTPFCRLMAQVHRGPPGDLEAVEKSLGCYVLATARKPLPGAG